MPEEKKKLSIFKHFLDVGKKVPPRKLTVTPGTLKKIQQTDEIPSPDKRVEKRRTERKAKRKEFPVESLMKKLPSIPTDNLYKRYLRIKKRYSRSKKKGKVIGPKGLTVLDAFEHKYPRKTRDKKYLSEEDKQILAEERMERP